MLPERHVKLFRNGANQALRIPREFELPGHEAIVKKDGDRLIIESIKPHDLLGLLAGWKALDVDFPDIDDNLKSLDDVVL